MSATRKSHRATRLLAVAAVCASTAALPAAAQAFNPQPDPPGKAISVSVARLNPQPLPPIVFLPADSAPVS